jgi:hypothetical protein
MCQTLLSKWLGNPEYIIPAFFILSHQGEQHAIPMLALKTCCHIEEDLKRV